MLMNVSRCYQQVINHDFLAHMKSLDSLFFSSAFFFFFDTILFL